MTEVFEFGRRLYWDDQTVSAVTFRIALEGVLHREGSGDSLDDLPYGARAVRDAVTYSVEVPRAELVGGILAPGVEAAESLFGQLGFTDISRGFIERKAQEFLSGRV